MSPDRPVSVVLAALILVLLTAGGCGRVPRIIVLEDPLTAAEHVDLGLAYERKGELDLAQREYERALARDKNLFQARVNLGNVRLAKKEYGAARKEYLRALSLRPGDAEAANNLSWAAILSGEGIDEALVLMEALVPGPAAESPSFLDTLGVLRMHANRPGPAAEAFSRAEILCREAGPPPGPGGPPAGTGCPEDVRREIAEHRAELQRRFPSPTPSSPLVK